MAKTDPAFLFNAPDWLESETVRAMTFEQRGIYLELLSMAWLKGSIPADEARLRQMLGLSPAKWRKLWPLISECWTPKSSDDGRLVNPRQEEERRIRREKAEEMRRRGAAGGKRSAQQRGSTSQPRGQAHASPRARPQGQAQTKPSTSTSTSTPTPPSSGGAKQQAEPDPPPSDDRVVRLAAALAETPYRGGMVGLQRSVELQRRAAALAPTGLETDDVLALWELAGEKADSRGPGPLLGHWLDQNLWREVLDEQRMKRKELAARMRGSDGGAAAREAEVHDLNEKRNAMRRAVAAGGT